MVGGRGRGRGAGIPSGGFSRPAVQSSVKPRDFDFLPVQSAVQCRPQPSSAPQSAAPRVTLSVYLRIDIFCRIRDGRTNGSPLLLVHRIGIVFGGLCSLSPAGTDNDFEQQ